MKTVSNTAEELNQVYFMLVKTTAAWLALSAQERFAFLEAEISPLLKKHPSVKLRFFDSEAFSGHFTDVLMWEAAEVKEYQFLVEALRETRFWGTYFEIAEIIPAIENSYALYYQVEPFSNRT